MDLEVLLSTMYQKDDTFLRNMNLETNCLAINQTNTDKEIYHKGYNYRIISTYERGLSRSRNMAIDNMEGDICILSDDDVEYVEGYSKIIIDEFEKNPDYDILAFMVEGKDKKFKEYSKKEKRLGYITSLKVSSVEIAFKAESIKKNNIKFNELLGTGSLFYMGEENAFLYACLRKGLRIKYIPKKIADIYVGNSTWFNGFDKEYFVNKGAAFTGMTKRASIFLIIQFAIRHYINYKDSLSFINAFKNMLRGRKVYISKVKELNL